LVYISELEGREKIIMTQIDQTTVLIIDDDATFCKSCSYFINDMDYQTITAENGQIGLDKLKQANINLILVDMMMPVMGGLEFIKQAKQSNPTIPIIIISGEGIFGNAIEALRLGADDYLMKPVNDLELLKHTVNNSLEKARLIRENHHYQTQLESLVDERTIELQQANQKLTDINTRLRNMVDSISLISGNVNLDCFANQILDVFIENMNASDGRLYSVENECLHLLQSLETKSSYKSPIPESIPLTTNSLLSDTVKQEQIQLVVDATTASKQQLSGIENYQEGSIIAFPIPGEQPVGILVFHRQFPPAFIEHDKEIGMILTSFAGEMLKNLKAFDALRISEKKYRTLFNKTNDAIFLIDNETGNFQDTNHAATLLTGHTTEQLTKLRLEDVLEKSERTTEVLQQMSLHLTDTQYLGLVTYQHPNTENRTAQLTTVPLSGKEKFGMARDITEEQKMQSLLHVAQKMEAIGQLSGGLAHDFNNILGIIIGNADLLEILITDNDKALQCIKTIKKSSQRAANLTRQLLNFSQQQSKHDDTIVVTNPNNVINEMHDLIEKSLTSNIQVTFSLAPDLWNTSINTGDFADTVLNLLINARDAMSNEGHITIETKNYALDKSYSAVNPGVKPGDYIELSITDDGIGISKTKLERIFDPFYTTKPKDKGTGLGLSMVFSFVQRSNGHIKVLSAIGLGTTFKLYFPRSEADKVINQSTANEKNNLISANNETILVVDDEEDLLLLAKINLQQHGYRVLTANDAQSALEQLINESNVSLLFSDVILPGKINGYELAKRSIKLQPKLKVLITSGYIEKDQRNKDNQPFNRHFLSKPYSHKEMVTKVIQLLAEKNTDEQ
jgi:PAS domain S-box-containing protein